MYELLANFVYNILLFFDMTLIKFEQFSGIPYGQMNYWLSPILLTLFLTPFYLLVYIFSKIFSSIKEEVYIYVSILLFIILLSFFTYINSIFSITGVTGISMLPNFNESNEILRMNFYSKNKINYGDVVVIEDNNNKYGNRLIKRVIGLPGDRIYISHGIIFLNGSALKQNKVDEFRQNEKAYKVNEEFISNDISYKILDYDIFAHQDYLTEKLVPKNHYFVLGDNRDFSRDSRDFGFVHKSEIIHKVLITESDLLKRISYTFLGYYNLR